MVGVGEQAPTVERLRELGLDTKALAAAERQLLNPFDPVQALPKSAEFLRELRTKFGNLGLAAAAYNAGPKRVADCTCARRAIRAACRSCS